MFFLCAALQIPTDFNFRIHTRNGWFGPETQFGGVSGFAKYVRNEDELNTLLSKQRNAAEVLILPDTLINKGIINNIENNYKPIKNLKGVFVYITNKSETSTASTFPNKAQSVYESNYEWNPYGKNEQYSRIKFPIFYPPQRIIETIVDNTLEDSPSAGIYVDFFMNSRGNAKYCLSHYNSFDPLCQPVGGMSLIGGFNNQIGGDAVWLISQMDAFGIAPYGQVGADYSISGFVASIAALEALKNVDWSKATKPLHFAFFDGEETGNIGSSRFLYEIQNFTCDKYADGNQYCQLPLRYDMYFQNLSLNDFSTIVEVKSVGLAENGNNIYAHTQKTEKSKQFVQRLAKVPTTLKVQEADSSTPGVPPSSTMSFLRVKKDIQHVVFAGHKGQYINKNIGTPADNQYNASYITNVATSVARTLLSLCFETETPELVSANETLVDGLMKGFVDAPNASEVLREYFPNATLATDHVSLYAGVYNDYSYKFKHHAIATILKDAIRNEFNESMPCIADNNCTKVYGSDGYCSRDKYCERSLIRGHPAYSLAFEMNKKGEYEIVRDDEAYEVMAESRWNSPDIKYVLLPTSWAGRVTIGFGIIVWIVTAYLGLVRWNSLIFKLKK